VHVSGHILLMGLPGSMDDLLALMAPLRSKRLVTWRPVVIVDKAVPVGSGTWDAVAQFSDVYFVEVGWCARAARASDVLLSV
jgi:hypothetical protein